MKQTTANATNATTTKLYEFEFLTEDGMIVTVVARDRNEAAKKLRGEA